MENASKALIIAGSFLVGMIVLSIMVVLFSSFGDTGTRIMQGIQDTQIAEWNNRFLKYVGEEEYKVPQRDEYGNIDDSEEPTIVKLPTALTAYDIVTLANYARQSNLNNDFTDEDDVEEGSLYVRLDIVKTDGSYYPSYKNLEKKIGRDSFKNDFLKEKSQIETKLGKKFAALYRVYICDDDANKQPFISEKHKRLIQMQFVEYTDEQYRTYYETVQGAENFNI